MIRVQLARARRVAVVTAAALVVAGCSGGAAAQSDPGYVTGPGVVTRTPVEERVALPRVTGALLQGGELDSAEYPDTVLVYNVWGSWCAPCRAEAPALQEVWEQTRDRGVQFVGVNVKDNDAAARAFEREFGITYPSITTADSGAVLLAFRSSLPPNAIPSTLVVDRDGRVAARIVGATTYTKLRRLVDEVLAEPTREPAW
jgi:thiol-disulfide isomerase/thioredoxin